jgi:hypothetical protein
MSFPSSPVNGQSAIVNGISYSYSSAFGTWTRGTTTTALSGNVTVGNIQASGYFWANGLIYSPGAITQSYNITNNTLTTPGISAYVSPTTGANVVNIAGDISAGNLTLLYSANIVGNIISTGNLTTSGILSTGSVNTIGNLTTVGNVIISGNLILNNPSGLTITSGNITNSGNIVSSGDLVIGGNLNIPNSVNGLTIIGNITSNGNLTTNGNLITNGNLFVNGNVIGNISNGIVTSVANSASGFGYVGLPQNLQTASYTVTATDVGKQIYVTVSSQTITIPANATLPFPIGTMINITTAPGITTSVAVTTDALYWMGTTGTTGTRTLAAYGTCTLVKVASTTWYISGIGLS